MESFADGIGNLIGFQLMLGLMFGVYLAPSIGYIAPPPHTARGSAAPHAERFADA